MQCVKYVQVCDGTMFLLLIVAMGLAVHADPCPTECRCRNLSKDLNSQQSSTLQSVTCSGFANFTALPKTVANLALRKIAQNVAWDELTGFADNLQSLAITDSDVDNITGGVFQDFQSLRYLDMSKNTLTDEWLELANFNLSGLLALDLSNNRIRVIYYAPFRTLPTLEVLNLSGNAIETVSTDTFRDLFNLQCLDLSGNNLTELQDDVFVPLESLQHLNLSNNHLEVLDGVCFSSLLRLQQLDVSWNRLARVSPTTLQALPSLARLLLAGNPALGETHGEPALLVGTGRRLQTVDASRTGLTHVPAALTHSVRTLRIAGNSIRMVNGGDLDSYPLLQLLDFTSNKLESVEDDALGRLEMLSILYLTDNVLRAIPRSLPDELRILHLEKNRIEQIVAGDLLGLPKLEVLLLNDNKIGVIQEGAFSQLTSLVTLDLSRNPMTILPADTLSGPTQLQVLRLSSLGLDTPAQDMAFPVPSPEYLVVLDLSDSPGLARQLLGDSAALAAFRELQELSLSDAGLRNIRSDLLHFLPQLRVLHLRGNQLNCTDLLWLAQWMRRQDYMEYREVTCASPPDLYGTLVVDLQTIPVTYDTDTSTSSTTTTPATTTTTQYPPIYQEAENTTIEYPGDVPENSNSADNVTGTDNNLFITPTEDPFNNKTTLKENPDNNGTADELLPRGPPSSSTTTREPGAENKEVSGVGSSTTVSSRPTVDGENVTASTGEMSMYSAGGGAAPHGLHGFGHPGMLILIVAALGGMLVCVMLATHITRHHQRRKSYSRQEDIEVDSLQGMNELW